MIAFDSETELITPWHQFPPVACFTACDGRETSIYDPWVARDLLAQWFAHEHVGGANTAFDAGVTITNFPELTGLVFDAYQNDRVHCVQVNQKLIDIAEGRYRGFRKVDDGKGGHRLAKIGYALDDLTARHTQMRLTKPTKETEATHPRLRYGEVRGRPVSTWPADFVQYAKDDATATHWVLTTQWKDSARWLQNAAAQTRADFALKLTSAQGLRTDPAAVGFFETAINAWHADLKERLSEPVAWAWDGYKWVASGLVRKDGSRDTKAAAMRMLQWCELNNLEVRRTEKGAIALDSDSCKLSGDPILELFGDYGQAMAVKSKDLEFLNRGTVEPICCRYEVLVETGRTSSSNPNVQNLRRLPGIREAFIPPPGHVFAIADFGGLELATMAQACLELVGYSHLADMLNRDVDPHLQMAANMLHMSYPDAQAAHKEHKKRVHASKGKDLTLAWIDNARQAGKVANFGFPGGLGADSLVEFARAVYRVKLTRHEARELKRLWLATLPEFNDYFRAVSDMVEMGSGITQLFTGRHRGRVRYTSACNSFFQGLGSDVAKRAGWAVVRGCYAEPWSALYGARPCMFVHDEWILTCPESRGHEVATALAETMVRVGSELLPGAKIDAKPIVARRLSKEATQIKDASGRIIPWDADYQSLVRMKMVG